MNRILKIKIRGFFVISSIILLLCLFLYSIIYSGFLTKDFTISGSGTLFNFGYIITPTKNTNSSTYFHSQSEDDSATSIMNLFIKQADRIKYDINQDLDCKRYNQLGDLFSPSKPEDAGISEPYHNWKWLIKPDLLCSGTPKPEAIIFVVSHWAQSSRREFV